MNAAGAVALIALGLGAGYVLGRAHAARIADPWARLNRRRPHPLGLTRGPARPERSPSPPTPARSRPTPAGEVPRRPRRPGVTFPDRDGLP